HDRAGRIVQLDRVQAIAFETRHAGVDGMANEALAGVMVLEGIDNEFAGNGHSEGGALGQAIADLAIDLAHLVDFRSDVGGLAIVVRSGRGIVRRGDATGEGQGGGAGQGQGAESGGEEDAVHEVFLSGPASPAWVQVSLIRYPGTGRQSITI